MERRYDVVVIGGGPAGLAGALWLARYELRTLLVDADNPRNAPTWAVHGYLGIPDPSPDELRRLGRAQAEAAGAGIEEATVANVTGERDAFRVELADGEVVGARRILFATGLRDIIPEIPGLLDHYGTRIWHCADCDGPGVKGLRVGVVGWGRQIAAFCMGMLTWTPHLTLLSHGRDPELPPAARAALDRFDIPVRTEAVTRVVGRGEDIDHVVLEGGERIALDALFFHIAYGPGCSLPAELGCEAEEDGTLQVDADFETTVPGIYAAGDITPGAKLAINAAAAGTRAAIGIYRGLMPEDRRV